MMSLRKLCLGVACMAVLLLVTGILIGNASIWQPSAVVLAVTGAFGIGAVPALKNYQYTAWIIAAVVVAMVYPQAFVKWGPVELRNKWLILIIVQMVMFGMGIQMSIRDFSGLATSGKGVLVGLMCHFSIMPLMGLLLTKIFHFEPEVAAGVILIGCCSSGLASNVMVYLARANLVLSVTVTTMTTLAAPFLTPLLMRLLAGTLVEVKFVSMMMEIIKIVIVPIGAAFVHDYLKRASAQGKRNTYVLAFVFLAWLISLPLGVWGWLSAHLSETAQESAAIFNFLTGAFIVGTLYHQLYLKFKKLDDFVPYLSMFGIVYFTTVTTAAGRDNLLNIGLLLFLSSVIHNGAGYFFGYWLSRVFGLDKSSARTIAFEVGLQNGGMASGLAGSMGKLATIGLAPAVFSPWMNISGSILANFWRKRPVPDAPDNTLPDHIKIPAETEL
ncbi:BASS family bile acid:Na+ symporter [Mucilaginibacter yixingensis]|uniref:BASS family bile acid:Na+ symporter n=1 Tax=Mucilaginibacter yixingensis TaxID=1295612 RepID=A0A2T5J9S0_9SPHI|nr:bile acid:sodium symporter family protein [Mucilaginibacter yixingensis]PTQ96821.1 BASS family bile acid:Na+ symporter [Mucilaginibacter yixingensis]